MGRAEANPSISSIRDGCRCALPILLTVFDEGGLMDKLGRHAPREGGLTSSHSSCPRMRASSTPRLLGSSTAASGILDRPITSTPRLQRGHEFRARRSFSEGGKSGDDGGESRAPDPHGKEAHKRRLRTTLRIAGRTMRPMPATPRLDRRGSARSGRGARSDRNCRPRFGENWFPLGRKRLYGAAQGLPVHLDHLAKSKA
jgi:hypothetical protein